MTVEKRSKRRRRGAVVYTPIAVLLIIIIIIFGISVFFRISVIEVTGAKKYTEEQILSVSGIQKGDNLLFVDTKASIENIGSSLPYLNEIIVDKIIPDKIVIRVTESQPIATLSYNGDWWILDQKARVLEKTDYAGASEKIEISGIDPASVAEGRTIFVADEQQTKLQYLINVLSAIYAAEMAPEVNTLDVSNIGNISFTYANRFTVIMGSGENAEYKLSMMENVIMALNPDDKGKIDLSRDDEPHFVPY